MNSPVLTFFVFCCAFATLVIVDVEEIRAARQLYASMKFFEVTQKQPN